MSAPVVLLHGFSGHADGWRPVQALLPERRTHALTLFGHDPSAPATTQVTFEAEVARVAERVRAIGEPVRICGYSMGGRITLGLLSTIAECIESAVLVGANPGLTSDADREPRVLSDEVWARLLEDDGVEAFAEKWQAQGLFASQARLPAERLAAQHATRLRHDGRSLAMAMRSLSLGRMPSYWDVLATTRVPVELVVGALDEKFSALATRMKARMADGVGRVLRVRDAGHNVVLERPEVLASIVSGTRATPLPADVVVE